MRGYGFRGVWDKRGSTVIKISYIVYTPSSRISSESYIRCVLKLRTRLFWQSIFHWVCSTGNNLQLVTSTEMIWWIFTLIAWEMLLWQHSIPVQCSPEELGLGRAMKNGLWAFTKPKSPVLQKLWIVQARLKSAWICLILTSKRFPDDGFGNLSFLVLHPGNPSRILNPKSRRFEIHFRAVSRDEQGQKLERN